MKLYAKKIAGVLLFFIGIYVLFSVFISNKIAGLGLKMHIKAYKFL